MLIDSIKKIIIKMLIMEFIINLYVILMMEFKIIINLMIHKY